MPMRTPLTLVLLTSLLGACAATPQVDGKPTEAKLNNEDWYQVRSETQLYLFDDQQVFQEFLRSGQAPVVKDLGQQDKYGQAILLGLRAEDQGTPLEQLSAYRFLQVAQPPAASFYGEIRQEGVIYVFARYGDMVDMNRIGEPTFSHTEIGSGPQGERVVYVLAKEEKKPVEQIKRFQARYKGA